MIAADQAGNANYNPASQVIQNITIDPAVAAVWDDIGTQWDSAVWQ